jgi:hypothetical protein
LKKTGRTGSNSQSEVEKNKRLAAERLTKGATKKEIRQELGVCRQTLAKYLEGLDIDWAALNAPAVAPLKKKMVEQLLQMADDVIAGVVPTRLADTWRGLMSDIREMLPGMNAPTTSVTAHVDATNTTVQYRFLERSHGLSAEQIEQVFRFMDTIPRAEVIIDMTGFMPALPPAPVEGDHD